MLAFAILRPRGWKGPAVRVEIVKINCDNPEASLIRYAADQIRAGEVLGMPTDTFYGLAADPLNFDLFPDRSLVRFLLAHGFSVYLADFGSPQQDHSHLGLADYTTEMLPEAIAKVR